VGNAGSNGGLTGLRFASVAIPRGAVILSANVEMYSTQNNWIVMGLEIRADASDSSAGFTVANPVSARALTSAFILHNSNTRWLPNSWNVLDSVTPVLQEIVNRPGWQNGNAMSLVIIGRGGNWSRKFIAAFETNPALATRLVITYRVN
jgi:hypothetical protein